MVPAQSIKEWTQKNSYIWVLPTIFKNIARIAKVAAHNTRYHKLLESAPNIKSFNIKNFRFLAVKRQTEHQNKLPGNSSLNVSLVFPVFPVCPVCSVHDHDHHDCHVHIYTQVGGYIRKLEAIWPEVHAQPLQSRWIDNHQLLSQSHTYVGRNRAARAAKNNFDVPFKCAFVGFFPLFRLLLFY